MAKKNADTPPKKSNLFQKGQSGNPTGRPKLPEEVKQFRKTSYEDFVNGLQKYGAMPVGELEMFVERSDIPAFERMFANIVGTASSNVKEAGQARELIMDRLWGKPKETNLDSEIANMSDDQLETLGVEALKYLKEKKNAS